MRDRLLRRLMLIFGLLGFTLAAGTIGFRAIEGYGWFDAFYRALTTITTVGSPEARPLGHRGRLFNSGLILFGVSAMFLAVGAITQTAIEVELQDLFGRRRRRKMIEALQDHFIVCGYGRVGRNASLELRAVKAPFLIMERNPERVAKAAAAGMLVTAADATQDDCLLAAGVMRARGLIAALTTDADNLFTILSAKTLNPDLMIVARASEEEAGEKLRRAGAEIVLKPYSMAGRQLADALLRPQVREFLDFARGDVGRAIRMEQVCLGPKSGAGGKRLGELPGLGGFSGIVLGIRRHTGETVFHPSEEEMLETGDFLIVMGEREALHCLDEVLTH